MRKSTKPPELVVVDDGLYTPQVGSWAETKYRLLWHYADLFATSMKDKWDERVYIDLFSAAGYARIRESQRVVLGSPLLALQVTHPFDRYIFCDQNPECIDALSQRVAVRSATDRVRFILGDANRSTAEILAAMPPHGPRKRVLAFCFVDPFSLSGLEFGTIRRVASRFVDFLVHIPAMDPLRNENIYTARGNATLDRFLGRDDWRSDWDKPGPRTPFHVFVAHQFAASMRALSYEYGGLGEAVMVRSTDKNLPLYRLGFFSRHKLGAQFWREAKKYSDPQLDLF